MAYLDTLPSRMADAFSEEPFLRKLSRNRDDVFRLFNNVDWRRLLAPLLPIQSRLSCAEALAAFRPVLDGIAIPPPEGWLPYAYQAAASILYPQEDLVHSPAQRDGAICFLQFLRELFTAERKVLPFDPWLDFAF